MLHAMRSVIRKGAQVALGCVSLALGACGSQPAPRSEVRETALVKADAPPAPAPAAPAATAEHASCGSQGPEGQACGCSAHGPGHAEDALGQAAASEGCCGGGSCGSGEGHGASCGGAEQTAAAQPEPARDDGASAALQLTRITDPSQVCMVRNHFMGRPQLSVATEAGTYYGCCAGCANRLLQDPGARVAVDPVSHHPVDKALAVLAKTPRGQVLYFESEQTLSAFRAGLN